MRGIIVRRIVGFGALLVFVGASFSCTNKKIEEYGSCVGCHTDEAHLEAIQKAEEHTSVGGCGGEAPYYEPYERVFMGGAGYEEFKSDPNHGSLSCTYCHGGVDGVFDKEEAHSGEFLVHPSDNYKETCGNCHTDIANNFKHSLHNGIGQKRKVTMRSGETFNGLEDFNEDALGHAKVEGYNSNCANCHGDCGNCHVNRPIMAGGGLANGHKFTKNPDMIKTCVTCHTSRGGHAYLGVAKGTDPDVHLTKMGFECMSCHRGKDGYQLHGDSTDKALHRYEYSRLPSCENCHSGIESSNKYHSKHYDDFNCQVCHSQDYNNCGSCHVHGDGARVPSYLDFKIAKNPIPDDKPGYDFALVRRTLAAPDNWGVYEGEGHEYAGFDAFPTYNYTTPHNIQLFTTRTADSATVVNQKASASFADMSCGSQCHPKTANGDTINKNLYLFEKDLLDWEIEATSNITVDLSDFPAHWMN